MPEKPEKLREEAVKYFNETVDLIRKGKPEESLESLQLAEKAAQEAKDGAILFHTLKVRGQILQSVGRLEEALETYAFSLRTSEKLISEDPENKLYLDTVRLNLNNIGNLGNIFQRVGNFTSSKQCYEIGLEICQRRLESRPENEFYQMYAGNTFNNLGELLFRMGHVEEAKEKYEKALKIYEKLIKSCPKDMEYLSDKEMTYNNLGILFSEKGQKEEAKKNFKEALDILEILSKKDPKNKDIKEKINLRRDKLEVN
ncbi:tetratricopeptide repeat protein [Methanosarcina sp.]|uniref:tetratricopeptide repeat protein n=1 Tax=Methanosarcina sp. TaxID=2213 RepID=UPI002ABC48C2|nr:tetratricopeptide repeat protein [Methanosarcina sp.]MDY9927156.1 tetratricopeptide repeat protein [Methanosarcina sp.]